MANADLIAAAPDLLEAAILLLQVAELNDVEKYTRSRIEDMQHAIAKATGKRAHKPFE